MDSQKKTTGVKRKTPSRAAKTSTETGTKSSSQKTTRKRQNDNSSEQKKQRSVRARLSSSYSISSGEDDVFEMAGGEKRKRGSYYALCPTE